MVPVVNCIEEKKVGLFKGERENGELIVSLVTISVSTSKENEWPFFNAFLSLSFLSLSRKKIDCLTMWNDDQIKTYSSIMIVVVRCDGIIILCLWEWNCYFYSSVQIQNRFKMNEKNKCHSLQQHPNLFKGNFRCSLPSINLAPFFFDRCRYLADIWSIEESQPHS